MSDLISRQAAIDVEEIDEQIRYEMCRNPMHTDRGCDGNCKYDENLYERIMQILGERIKPLPSAEKTGKWIEKEICETRRKEEMQVAKCSNCGKYLTTPYFYSFTHYSFCPNCGATMKGDALK